MRILKSPSDFDLFAILTDLEAVLYREAFRTKTPVMIPELNDEIFIIKEIERYEERGAPKNAWRLVIKPKQPDYGGKKL